jgi:hypothetical protein
MRFSSSRSDFSNGNIIAFFLLKKLENQIVDNTKFSDSDGASHWSYLFDEGNNRLFKSPITNLVRPKSEPVLNTTAKANRSPSKKEGFRKNKTTILGYDWITGLF